MPDLRVVRGPLVVTPFQEPGKGRVAFELSAMDLGLFAGVAAGVTLEEYPFNEVHLMDLARVIAECVPIDPEKSPRTFAEFLQGFQVGVMRVMAEKRRIREGNNGG